MESWSLRRPASHDLLKGDDQLGLLDREYFVAESTEYIYGAIVQVQGRDSYLRIHELFDSLPPLSRAPCQSENTYHLPDLFKAVQLQLKWIILVIHLYVA